MVSEGEYRMLNTFDLTVDRAFHELRFSPCAAADHAVFEQFTAGVAKGSLYYPRIVTAGLWLPALIQDRGPIPG